MIPVVILEFLLYYDGMKKEDIKTEYFDCDCFSPEHTLRFVYIPAEDVCGPELYTEIHLTQYRNVFERIWAAIKYVFGYKCRYGNFDSWMLSLKDADRLIGLINKFKEESKACKEKDWPVA